MGNLKISYCKQCHAPIDSYKHRLDKEHVIFVRSDVCCLVEETENIDNNNTYIQRKLDEISEIVDTDKKSIIKRIKADINLLNHPIDNTPEHRIVKEFSLDSLISNLESMHKVETGILPRDTIWHSDNINRLNYIIQKPPGVVNLLFSSGGNTTVYQVAMPFTQYYLSFINIDNQIKLDMNNIYISLTNIPIKSFDDPIYRIPIHNQHGDGKLCVGSAFNEVAKNNIVDTVNSVIARFFSTEWNNDLAGNTRWPEGISSLEEWQAKSRKNSMFVCGEVKWQQHPLQNVKTAVQTLNQLQ